MGRTARWLGAMAGLAVFLAATRLAAQPPPAARLRLEQYREALRSAQQQGRDTSTAEQLAQRSRRAARQGDQAEAERLLGDAIKALGGSTELPPERPARPGPPPTPRRTTAASGPAAPVFFLAFTHHYNGPGGYYPTAAEVREIGA